MTSVAALRAAVAEARAAGQRIGFVPTMGALHEGHLALAADARRRSDFVVMSIFVNPLQFGPNEDFAKYPRDAEGDATKAADRGVDLLFLPDVDTMYPAGRSVTVEPGSAATRWEGEIRPGHFSGVLTVVAKLFNLVMPDVAIFGQKDLQQVTLVRAMVHDLDFPVEIVVHPIVREHDGLALSSRNVYLSAADRERAQSLSRALSDVRRRFAAGERRSDSLVAAGRAGIASAGIPVDYFAVVDPMTLESVAAAREGTPVIVAARFGMTRLIDNTVLGSPEPALDR